MATGNKAEMQLGVNTENWN